MRGVPRTVINQMVEQTAVTERQDLSRTFAALGDPVRRAIVERLAQGDATVTELAAPFPISLQAVSQHIKVLEAAGVVSRRAMAQTRPVHLEPAALARSADWLEAHRRRLDERFGRLDELLEQTKGCP